eukprot:TRINITY_DN2323_c0_g1_i7.p1 TRINITY_DN2323_c0_g1~~TRINITY_DN2323_c0_g1_i7.p1  ORF type:complete len:436 (-),score=63.83 TRINITY_DN2323_c0_g1_i7:275-1582(-)
MALCTTAAALLLAAAVAPTLALESNSTQLRGTLNSLPSSSSVANFPRTQIRWNPDVRYCLSADGNKIKNGVKIQLWQCDPSWQAVGQVFSVDFSHDDGLIRVKEDPAYCLVVDANNFVNGAKIQLWKCDAHNNAQRWRFWGERQERHGESGVLSPALAHQKCLVIDYNKASNGAKIQLWDCGSGDDSKRWAFGFQALAAQRSVASAVSNGSVALAAAAAPSLALEGNATRPRGTLNDQPSSLSAPHFPRTQIRWSRDVRYCLSADHNKIRNGVKIQLWQCDHSWHAVGQVFSARFSHHDGLIRVKENPAYCLVVDANHFVNGAKIQLWKCDANNNAQRWRFWGERQERHGESGLLSPALAHKKCLVIDYNKAFNGAKIQLWDCGSGDNNKRWAFGFQALAAQRSSISEMENATATSFTAGESTSNNETIEAIFYP